MGIPATEVLMAASSASDVVLDISGSTVEYPSSGQVLVSITQGASVLASQQFAWTRYGDSLVLNNPDAVDAWAAGYAESMDGLAYDLVPAEVQADPGMNTFSVETEYLGQTMANASTTFCYNPHQPPSPHLPPPCV